MATAVLALDQGGHASRACLFDATGTLVAQAQVPVGTQQRGEDEVEHDAQQLADTLLQAAARVLALRPDLVPERAALATQRSTIVCFERHSVRALSPAISWQDRRAAQWLAGFSAAQARITAITGLPLSPHYGAGKLRWCLDHLPAVRAAQQRADLVAGPLSAWLVTRLTGAAPCVDPANASRTLLYDARSQCWSDELITLFGIDAGALPACVPTCRHFGALRVAAHELALEAVTGDQSAIPFAYGTPDEHTLYVNLGTGAFLQQPRRHWPAAAPGLLRGVLAAGARRSWYSLEGTVNGAGSATAWYARQSGVDENRLWAALEDLPPDTALPVFINGIGGLGSPHWQAHLNSQFVEGGGGAGTGSDPTLRGFAAVVESLLFLITANYHCLCQLEDPPQRVIVTGGLSRSDWLCQRMANLLAIRVSRTDTEATVRGAAALAAPELARQWPPARADVFEPRTDPALQARRSQFDATLQTALDRISRVPPSQ